MRIAHFLSYYPAHAGTTTAVRGLARGLASLGHEITIWTYSSLDASEDESLGLIVRRFAANPISKHILSQELKRHIQCNADKYDLVVLHGQFIPLLITLAIVLKKHKIPYVVSPHGAYHPSMLLKNAFTKKCYGPIERWLLNSSDGIQVLSSYQIPYLEKYGVRNIMREVPNGMNPSKESLPSLSHAPGEVARLLFLGRIDTYTKGLDILFEAVGLIKPEIRSTMKLYLVGPDWQGRAQLDAIIDRLGISGSIEFLGPDYQRPPVRIISDYDLLVVSSRHDGFPTVVLEAMEASRPVLVSTETGITKHVVNAGCGWIAEPEPESFANVISKALNQRHQWALMGKRGKDYVIDNLTWEQCAGSAVNFYEEVIQTRQAATLSSY